MTVLTIDTQDSRTAKALQIAANAGQWIRVRSKEGRPLAFGVPSQTHSGTYYMATTQSCTCEDFKRRGQPCKHIAAVALIVAVKRSQKAHPTRQRTAALAARYDDIFKRFAGD